MNKKTVFYTSPPSSPSSSTSSASSSSVKGSSSVKSTPLHYTLEHCSDPKNKCPSKNFVFSPFSSRSSPYPPREQRESKPNFSSSRPPVFGISARDRLLKVEMGVLFSNIRFNHFKFLICPENRN